MHQAFAQEEQRLKPVLERQDYKSDVFIYNSYKSRGRYKEQLERYFKYFPRERILIVRSEDLFGDPNAVLERIFEFLGVDSSFTVKHLAPRNVGKSKTPVPSEVYEYLNSYFRPHNEAFYEFVGQDYGW